MLLQVRSVAEALLKKKGKEKACVALRLVDKDGFAMDNGDVLSLFITIAFSICSGSKVFLLENPLPIALHLHLSPLFIEPILVALQPP
ncbi:hypothetical protein CRYUN_Cryun09bG0153400 [Craigia yunnanensis]